jgi:hypothetical protein
MRIATTVKSCGSGCPNYKYSSGGIYECELVKQPILDKKQIAPFCPLPKYPAEEIARLMRTVECLRKEHAQNFLRILMSFVATQLKTTISADGRSIDISIKDGGVFKNTPLSIDRIIGGSFDANSYEVRFFVLEEVYVFIFSTTGAKLYRVMERDEKENLDEVEYKVGSP